MKGMSFLANNYGDSVVYYSSQRLKADVLNEKQQFVIRWPVRIYAVRSGTAHAACFDVCTVFAVVDWYASAPHVKNRPLARVNA